MFNLRGIKSKNNMKKKKNPDTNKNTKEGTIKQNKQDENKELQIEIFVEAKKLFYLIIFLFMQLKQE